MENYENMEYDNMYPGYTGVNTPPMNVSPGYMGPNMGPENVSPGYMGANMPPMNVSPGYMGPNMGPENISPAHMSPNMGPMNVGPAHMKPCGGSMVSPAQTDHKKKMYDMCKQHMKQKVQVKTVHGDVFNAFVDDVDADNLYLFLDHDGGGHDRNAGDERVYGWGGPGYGGWGGYGWPGYGYGYGGFGRRFILPLIFLAGLSAIR